MVYFIHFIILMVFTNCVTNDSASTKASHEGMNIVWHDGDIDAAFTTAKEENRPMFLYWGAVWCPPCNELKAQVFAHQKAGELLASSLNIYLDGDTELAQQWADRLEVTGYPTMLLMLPDGREVMRISEALTFEEFQRAYQAALQQKATFNDIFSQASTGTASLSDWRTLAYYSWYDAKDLDLLSPSNLSKRLLLVEKIPDKLEAEKALLAASILVAAKQAQEKNKTGTAEIIAEVSKRGHDLLNHIFKNYTTKRAARGFMIYQSKNTLDFLFANNSSLKAEWQKKWLDAVNALARDKNLSVDTRLWTLYPQIQFAKERGPAGITPALQNKVKNMVAQASKDAKTNYERTAVIPGAAHLLGEVNLVAESRSMLKNEIKKSKTPWYYQSSIAALEEKLGHKRQALYWSDQARRSAEGRASKIQWTASDLMRTIRLGDETRVPRVRFLVIELYQLATSYDDGFVGRNRFRMDSVSDTLKQSIYFEAVKKDLVKLKQKCTELDDKGQKACINHFATFAI